MSDRPLHEAALAVLSVVAVVILSSYLPIQESIRVYTPSLALLALTAILHLTGRLSTSMYRPPGRASVPMIASSVVGVVVTAQFTSYLVFQFLSPPETYLDSLRRLIPTTPQSLLLSAVMMWLVVAPAEESIFRGLVFGSLRAVMGFGKALALSSAVFALAHLDPWRIPPTLLVGLFTGLAYHRTGTLSSAIIVHGVNNTASLILSYLNL
ncbi:hypothetical protein HRbin01_01717 [archaeon HR01]|nr:hypothetical protein HRbin01_01717 [archaeon HR01]